MGFPFAALSVLPDYPAVPYWMPPLVALAFSGKGADEKMLLRSLLHNFKEGGIVLGDAFYCTCFLLAELQSRGVDLVFEQHGARKRTTDFRTGKSLGSRDHLVTLSKPKIRPGWMSIPMPLLTEPRQIAREKVKKYGHPGKLK